MSRVTILSILVVWLVTISACGRIEPDDSTPLPASAMTSQPAQKTNSPQPTPTSPATVTLQPTNTKAPTDTPIPTIVFPVLRGEYLGQEPPGQEAVLFAPGIVSTGMNERDITFTPDGKELYYSMHGEGFFVILSMKQVNGTWTLPRVAPFSGQYNNVEASVAPDGRRLFFASDRPTHKGDTLRDFNIWFVERSGDGWGTPTSLDEAINSEENEFYPSLAKDGTLYFTARYPGGKGEEDLYRSRLINGQYQPPENLGEPINSPGGEYNAFIAPDENYLIFGRAGLTWISFRQSDGSWTNPRGMDVDIGLSDVGWSPYVSYDGKYLFISNIAPPGMDVAPYPPSFDEITRTISDPENVAKLGKKHFAHENIYWISSQVIEILQEKSTE